MTIGRKLKISFGATLLLALALSIISWVSTGALGTNIDRLTSVNGKKLYLSGIINGLTSDLVANDRGILYRALLNDKGQVEKINQRFKDTLSQLNKALAEYEPLVDTEEARQLVSTMRSECERISRGHDEFFRFAQSGQTREANEYYEGGYRQLIRETNDNGQLLAKREYEVLGSAKRKSNSVVAMCRWWTASMIVLALVMAGVIILAINRVNRVLQTAVSELGDSSSQVASSATQVSSSAQSLAQGTSEQAASLQETSASCEEINSMTSQNAHNSQNTAELVTKAGEGFNATNAKLRDMVSSMNEINASSERIAKVIKIIDDIAFQTNILALNAAVEAARAGEAGMGFAVVADEVRNLAQRCAGAAKETSALIEESIKNSNEGTAKLGIVEAAIKELSQESEQIKMLVDEVSIGSQEQSRGLEQVSKAITQMEQVTQRNAAGAEEGAAAGEQLSGQAAALSEIVKRLESLVGSDQK